MYDPCNRVFYKGHSNEKRILISIVLFFIELSENINRDSI